METPKMIETNEIELGVIKSSNFRTLFLIASLIAIFLIIAIEYFQREYISHTQKIIEMMI